MDLSSHDAAQRGRLRRIARALKRFVDHPAVRLGVGLILIASGLIEAYDTVLDDLHRIRVRVGHGVIILGVVNGLASLPEVIEGLDCWLSYLGGKEETRPLPGGSNEAPEPKR